jgi:prepilin-type processing-associated H-X9-DG protein
MRSVPVDGGIETKWDEGLELQERQHSNLGGNLVFVDGSASRHPIQECHVASWAVAFFDYSDNFQASVAGPVWRHLPQTPQAAENTATGAAIQLMTAPTQVVGDCLGVTRAYSKLKEPSTPV